MKIHPLLGILAVLLLSVAAPGAELKKDKFHLGDWEREIGYCQAVRVGNTLYISGSASGGAMPDAIQSAYDELKRTLAAHGLTFHYVVKETVFTTNLDAFKENTAIRRAFYGEDFPAATWVQVQRLYLPEQVVEVEAIAVFPE